MIKSYVVVSNSSGDEINRVEIDSRETWANELVRVIEEEGMVFDTNDTITFVQE